MTDDKGDLQRQIRRQMRKDQKEKRRGCRSGRIVSVRNEHSPARRRYSSLPRMLEGCGNESAAGVRANAKLADPPIGKRTPLHAAFSCENRWE